MNKEGDLFRLSEDDFARKRAEVRALPQNVLVYRNILSIAVGILNENKPIGMQFNEEQQRLIDELCLLNALPKISGILDAKEWKVLALDNPVYVKANRFGLEFAHGDHGSLIQPIQDIVDSAFVQPYQKPPVI